MKIRIKGASLRLRLSKSEVARLVHEGVVEEQTPFGDSIFRYAVQKTGTGAELSAAFEGGSMTMFVPQSLIEDWDTNMLISVEANMPVAEGGSLYLLLEKDFQCIDATSEDQSDNYINPNQIC
jgi:hypothetical protein